MVANPAWREMKRGGLGPPARRAYASERNVAYGGNVNPPRNREGGSGNPPPKGRRAPVLSRPPQRGPLALTETWTPTGIVLYSKIKTELSD